MTVNFIQEYALSALDSHACPDAQQTWLRFHTGLPKGSSEINYFFIVYL